MTQLCAKRTALRRRAQWTNAAEAAGPGCVADSRQNVNAKAKGTSMMPTRMCSSRSGKENSATSWTTNTSDEVTALDIDYRGASIEALPLADASVDVVLSSVTMHHLPRELNQLGLAEVRRVLKPGGRLLIVDVKRPTGLLSHLALTSFIHSHATESIEDLPSLVAAAGFSEVRKGETGFRSLGGVSARAPQ
jgi:SAM-dependent methyltransferase